MGSLSVPLAASGGCAPVTLVEIKTGYTAPSPAAPIVPDNPPPAAPRSLGAGEVLGWSYATVPPVPQSLSEGPSVFNGFNPVAAASGGDATSGDIGLSGSDPIGLNFIAMEWSGFGPPAGMPRGATIVDVYPVVVVSALNAGGFMVFNGGGLNFGVAMGDNYGANVGSWAGKAISASISNTTGSSDVLNMAISFVAFAVIYTLPAGGGILEGDADSALATGAYFWSEHRAKWPSLITGQVEQFLDWLVDAQVFRFFGSTQTNTATITVQNVSGNTFERDVAKIFSRSVLIGALVAVRIWRGDAEAALLTFIGNITEVEIDDAQMVLTVEGFANYSAVLAPAYNIDKSCPLTFGSAACGSTSPTPCDQSYGGCSSINRFAGAVTQWDTECPNIQIAQPAPVVARNPGRAF